MRHPASSCRLGWGLGTWLKLAVGLMFLAAGTAASDAATQSGKPVKYKALRTWAKNVKLDYERLTKTSSIQQELQSTPPKPLQVFEYGPSRRTYLRNPKKYKYQYVCVVAHMGTVEEGIWHRRRAPINWFRVPPFHVRIVRPSPAGMLDYMLTKGKVKLVKREVTMTRTHKKTGEVVEVTRPMTTVERTDVDLPKHLKQKRKAYSQGIPWQDKRRSKGRWGPSPDPKDKERAVNELLAEVGIKSKEEAESIHQYIDDNGEIFDMRDVRQFSYTDEGRKAFKKLDREERKKSRRENKNKK